MKLMGINQKYINPRILFLLVLAFWGESLTATTPVLNYPEDDSDLSIDGPHVFYEQNRVIVKKISLKAGKFEMNKEEYRSRSEVPPLECVLDNELAFSIQLKSKISPAPAEVPQPNKLFAISDIEGNFHAFARTLMGNGVIDRKFNWTYGDGHLVLVGDFFDRGLNVTACLWLIYHMENQAAANGGMVHFVLGNHEEMNLSGDHRYVRSKYMKVAEKLNCNYSDLFASNTELGKWLRSKNVIVKIGETLFVHGGLSPQIAGCHLSIDQINSICRSHIGKPADELQEKGGNISMVFAKTGPLWYRGFFNELSSGMVRRILDQFGAEQVVVGHTIVDDISTLQDGMVYAIDVKHSNKVKNAQYNAMLIEDGTFFKVNYKGRREEIHPARRSKDDGSTIVFKAIKENNLSIIKAFLKQGYKINDLYSAKKYPLLHYALEHGSVEAIELLLDYGANPDLFFDGRSALMHCIKYNRPRALELLLMRSVNVNLTNHRLQTALFYVAKYGKPDLARALLEAGADLESIDQAGLTPFQFAVKNKNIPVARFLKSSRKKN